MNVQHLTIDKIEIVQFKKIKSLVLEPENGANLFFGSFRSGKTSLCEFIQFILYGADSVSLARGNTEDAEGSMDFCADGKIFSVKRSFIAGKEHCTLFSKASGEEVKTTLSPGEYLTGLDRDSFDLINYFRQAKYETPFIKPKFSFLNHIASFSKETETVYRDVLVTEQKRNTFRNKEQNGTLDLLEKQKQKLTKELEERPDWVEEEQSCFKAIAELQEKIDENDRRCVLIKADMAGYEDDIKLSRNKENAQELYHRIQTKEKHLRIQSFEVSGKIGKLPQGELNQLKGHYNRLSMAAADLNEARMALSSAEENLAFHEGLLKDGLDHQQTEEEKKRILSACKTRLLLRIAGGGFIGFGAVLFFLLQFLNYEIPVSLASSLSVIFFGSGLIALSTIFTGTVKKILELYSLASKEEFFELCEKVSAHAKTTRIYQDEVLKAQEKCIQKEQDKESLQSGIGQILQGLGYHIEDGELLANCENVIEANEALLDLEAELEADKEEYRKLLTEDIESDSLTVSTEFQALQKELAFLSVQNDALYKKKTDLATRLQEAKERTAHDPKQLQEELDLILKATEKLTAEFEASDMNYVLAKAKKDKFEKDLKEALAHQINKKLAFLLSEGESFRFDEDFELCFCDRKSILPLVATGGGVISEMGILTFRLSLAQYMKKNTLPMIFDDSLAILNTENLKYFYPVLRENCSQFFIATSSQELVDLCCDSAKLFSL